MHAYFVYPFMIEWCVCVNDIMNALTVFLVITRGGFQRDCRIINGKILELITDLNVYT